MNEASLYPMKLNPTFKDNIWGGVKLRTLFNKHSRLPRLAESWELSCHKDGQSTISNGKFQGLTLSAYIDIVGKSVLGSKCEGFKQFPVLIKFIDAAESLSVQVHPDDSYALIHEGEQGKTEMWYILDCDEQAEIIYGLNRSISKKEFLERVGNNTLNEVLNSVRVKRGDVFFIKAGTIHAIGKGIVIAEIQQNSNSTYRVYDFNRVDPDGRTRELHIDKALDVTVLEPVMAEEVSTQLRVFEGYTSRCLSSCEYFIVDLLTVKTHALLSADTKSFHSLTCIEGKLSIKSANIKYEIEKGNTVFIPAGTGDYTLCGRGKILYVHY